MPALGGRPEQPEPYPVWVLHQVETFSKKLHNPCFLYHMVKRCRSLTYRGPLDSLHVFQRYVLCFHFICWEKSKLQTDSWHFLEKQVQGNPYSSEISSQNHTCARPRPWPAVRWGASNEHLNTKDFAVFCCCAELLCPLRNSEELEGNIFRVSLPEESHAL